MDPTKPIYINGGNQRNNNGRCLMMINGCDRSPLEVCGSHFHHLQKGSCLSQVKSTALDTKHADNSPSSSQQQLSNELRRCDNVKPMKLKIVFSKTNTDLKFSPGTLVEVKSDKDWSKCLWYAATIVGSAGVGKFLVEYKNLMTEKKTTLLKENVDEQDIRPYPPDIPRSCRYEVLQGVDAWYNNGWLEGVVSEVLDGMKYFVYFASLNEKLIYHHSDLRPRQNWVDGKWVLASQDSRLASYSVQKRPSTLKLRVPSPKRKPTRTNSNPTLRKGMMVEVRSDEPGYEGSWYTAKIIRMKQNGKYVVEYLTLKTEDMKRRLREEADAKDIRPFPPKSEEENRYRLLQKVDAWYNEGWWVGVIAKRLPSRRYVVYFESTREEIDFDHQLLRIHREWVDGEWIAAE